MPCRRPALAAAAVLLIAACSTDDSHLRSDWEREHEGDFAREAAIAQRVSLPAAPREEDLLPFDAGAGRSFTFFVDRRSISVTDEGIVRYVLVARSPSGVPNVTYESMSCRGREVLVHASGRSDGSWNEVEPRWRPLTRPWHRALQRQYFCPKGITIASAQEGASALLQGGHPLAKPSNPLSGSGR